MVWERADSEMAQAQHLWFVNPRLNTPYRTIGGAYAFCSRISRTPAACPATAAL
jgi:hypothetical protein